MHNVIMLSDTFFNAVLSVIMLNVILLNVILLNVRVQPNGQSESSLRKLRVMLRSVLLLLCCISLN
jgi:hypothetical protein